MHVHEDQLSNYMKSITIIITNKFVSSLEYSVYINITITPWTNIEWGSSYVIKS